MDFRLTNSEEIRFNCPNCGDEKFHLYVNPTKGVFHCKKCEYKGCVKNLPDEFRKFVTEDILRIDINGLDKPVKSTVVVPVEYKRLLEPSTYLASQFWNYLLNRGMKEEDIISYHLGYCVGGKYDKRLIFPVIQNNSVIAFEARDIYGRKPKTIFQGSKDCFFNYDIVFEKNNSEEVILVEGIFDVFKTGKKNTLGCWGKTLTAGQQLLLRKRNPRKVTVFFDADAVDSIYKTAELLNGFIEKVEIAILDYGDPGSFDNPLGKANIIEYLGVESKMHYFGERILEESIAKCKWTWKSIPK